jgi:hypothetical protein
MLLDDRAAAPLDQPVNQLLELGASDVQLQVLRTVRISRDERQIDVGRLRRAEFFLRLLARFLQTLQGHAVLAEVDPLLFLEFAGDVLDQLLVEVIAAEVGVAVGAHHPEDAVGDFEH